MSVGESMPNIIHSSFYEVLGIGTPIIDQVILVSDEYIVDTLGKKGGSQPVDYNSLLQLITSSGKSPDLIIGGSTTNTIRGLTSLGRRCALFGKVGPDEVGKRFRQEIERLGIIPHLLSGEQPTAQVACLVSPDNERTMRSFLGAGMEMIPEELTPELFRGVKLVHIEGYVLAYGGLAKRAMELAKQAGAKISFDLSSYEITQRHKGAIIDLMSRYVDIVFANEEETKALTGLDPERGCDILKGICEVAIVKMGKQGSIAGHKEIKIYQPSFDVHTLDTTGAGDLFASGFLHGYLSKKTLEECSRYGALVASEVVKILGADIPTPTWHEIKKQLYIERD